MDHKEKRAEIRKEIDRLDERLIPLFVSRMELAEKMAALKREANLPLADPAREQEIINRTAAGVNPELVGHAQMFMRSLLGLSRMRQRECLMGGGETLLPAAAGKKGLPVKVAYQGVPGAWGEQAALQLFHEAEFLREDNFEDVFSAVKNGASDYGVIPIENSQTGAIGEVYDLLRKYGCYIVGQTWVHARHCLMALPGVKLADIREVYSHPEGFSQCRDFLRGRAWDAVACRNTALAAQQVAQAASPRLAAIASPRAAELNGLAVLAGDIMNDANNKTRFILISDRAEYDARCDAVSVIFYADHRSGALCDVLFPFMVQVISLSRIESRPLSPGRYCFFVDLEANMREERTAEALSAAAAASGYLEVLGCYRANAENEPYL
ncbi:MAG: chorismate mutase [Clostridiales bacterium]|nr:chorismate mutase [Clostridiales bacterium]